jgi:polyhydroxyalkanoate synthesis regulator phasin
MRDTVAELAERAQLISQEAGSKVAAAMKDVVSAAAGITGFAIESARDLIQYMVRRGQMTPEEGEKLIREAEAAHGKRPASEKARPTATKIAADRAAAAKAEAAARAAAQLAAFPPRMPPARPVPQPPAPFNNAHRVPAKSEPVGHARPAEKKAAPQKAPAKPVKPGKSAKPAKAPSAKASKPAKAPKKKK